MLQGKMKCLVGEGKKHGQRNFQKSHMGTQKLSARRRIIPQTLMVAQILAHTEAFIRPLRNPVFHYRLQMSGSLWTLTVHGSSITVDITRVIKSLVGTSLSDIERGRNVIRS
jgi:hypothetical protein